MSLLDLDDNTLYFELFEYVDTLSLLRLGMTCRRLRRLTMNESLWQLRGKALRVTPTNKLKTWRIVVLKQIDDLCDHCSRRSGVFKSLHNKILCGKCSRLGCYKVVTKATAKSKYKLCNADLEQLKNLSSHLKCATSPVYLQREIEAVAMEKYNILSAECAKRKDPSLKQEPTKRAKI